MYIFTINTIGYIDNVKVIFIFSLVYKKTKEDINIIIIIKIYLKILDQMNNIAQLNLKKNTYLISLPIKSIVYIDIKIFLQPKKYKIIYIHIYIKLT